MVNWKSIEFLEDYNEELLTENLLLHLKLEKLKDLIKDYPLDVEYIEFKYKLLEIIGDEKDEL